jgi:hypothetical protein
VYKILRLSTAAAIVAVASAMAFSAVAQAQAVFGQIAPGAAPEAECPIGGFDLLQNAVNEGSLYEAPQEGVITSWSTNVANLPGQIETFKVFRRVEGKVHSVLAHDTKALTPGVVNTFKVHIPVKAGDQIGLNTGNASLKKLTACLFKTGRTGDEIFNFEADVPDGGLTTATPFEGNEVRVNVSATLLAPPSLLVDGRGSLGPVTGGASVVLRGFNFAEVSTVAIGGVPARFTVDSEQQITAVAPPGQTLNELAVSVTTAAGTATSAEVFSYQGCLVPKLTGKKLKPASARLKGAGCGLGKVKRLKHASTKTGRVRRQSPKAGTVLAPGSKVSVTLGR